MAASDECQEAVVMVREQFALVLRRMDGLVTEAWRYGDITDEDKARLDEWLVNVSWVIEQGPSRYTRKEMVARLQDLRKE